MVQDVKIEFTLSIWTKLKICADLEGQREGSYPTSALQDYTVPEMIMEVENPLPCYTPGRHVQASPLRSEA